MGKKKKLLDIVRDKIRYQAFSAILFLYKEILGLDMSSWNIQVLRTQDEVLWSMKF